MPKISIRMHYYFPSKIVRLADAYIKLKRYAFFARQANSEGTCRSSLCMGFGLQDCSKVFPLELRF